MTSGQYQLAKFAGGDTRAEWFEKAQLLISFANTKLFQNVKDETAKTILNVIRFPITEK